MRINFALSVCLLPLLVSGDNLKMTHIHHCPSTFLSCVRCKKALANKTYSVTQKSVHSFLFWTLSKLYVHRLEDHLNGETASQDHLCRVKAVVESLDKERNSETDDNLGSNLEGLSMLINDYESDSEVRAWILEMDNMSKFLDLAASDQDLDNDAGALAFFESFRKK